MDFAAEGPGDPALPLELVLRRVGASADDVGDRFPLHADPVTGRWTTTRRGSWTGGFWAGLLWLVAAGSGSPEDRSRAAAVTARLRDRVHDDTDTRALTFWHGAAQGVVLCGDPAAAEMAREGAEALAASAHPVHGVIPAGTALGRGQRGAELLTVDAAAAAVCLLSWAGRTFERGAWQELAQRHAAAVLERCLDHDGAVRPTVALDGGTDDDHAAGAWPRGQAWGMLALAEAAGRLSGGAADTGFADAACLAADFWLDRTDGGVPPWSFTDPHGRRDTSAAAIAAEAMLVLGDAVAGPRGKPYRDAALGLLTTLVSRHLTRPGAGDRTPPPGMLLDGCYDMASGTAVANELIWGDYFLATALRRLDTAAATAPAG